MSDKGFGDPAGRGVLKNPLLSTAVTGLSIEDLTHNAVLLPVVRSQDLITSRDQSSGPQDSTLRNSEPKLTNIITSDINSNLTPSNITPSITPSLSGTKQDDNYPKINYPPTSSISNASAKSADDFDVNEYFARLQGTRYVSAPINSLIKEDSNASLEATEENLEEINLNEPDKSLEVQQSLTADIAQNFSQLPTVLPQVASAVFSSFSNMLSMKGREQTPDDPKVQPGHQVPLQREEINVPLMGVDEPVKDVAPPPKEPPIGGTSNYRITTKKKAYAQIPGLSSRDSAQGNPYPPSHNVPFIPLNLHITDYQNQPPTTDYMKPEHLVDNKQKEIDMFNPVSVSTYNVECSLQAPSNKQPNYSQNKTAFDLNADQAASNTQPNCFTHKVESVPQVSEGFESRNIQYIAQPPLIPPPPMFSNIPRRDSQSGIGKSVLPPSVARRISANHPVIKPQTSQTTFDTGNIFVPSIDNAQENQQLTEHAINEPHSFHSTSGVALTGIQPTHNPSFMQPQASIFPLSSSSQAAISTILPPTPTKPRTADTTQIDFQATNSSFVPTASLPQATSSFPVDLPPPPKKPIAPPSRFTSKSATSAFQSTSKSANLPPPPTNIFTPDFSADAFQPTSAFAANIQKSSDADVPLPPTGIINQVPSVSYPLDLQNVTSHAMTTTTITAPPMNIFHPSPISLSNPSPDLTPRPAMAAMNTTDAIPAIETSTQATVSNVPPTFFNSNTVQVQNVQNITQPNINSLFTPAPEPEPPKPVAEPPKISGNLNYRMTKKRPQYYSGPIEGVGSISNNVKPTLQSTVNPGNFHGALFMPDQNQELVAPTCEHTQMSPNIEHTNIPQSYHPVDISKTTEQSFETNYSTAFDLSRQTTEAYEPPKQETKGFGIIGSLKSKLGSLDINKIQNSVTTFFDPDYNSAKKEDDSHKQYGSQSNPAVFTQQDNLGICIDQNSQTYPHYNYQMNYQSQPNSYGENNQYYNTHEYFYQNQTQMYPSCTDFTQVFSQQNYQSAIENAENVIETGNIYHESIDSSASGESKITSDAQVATQTHCRDVEENDNVLSANSSGQALIQSVSFGETNLFSKQFLDNNISIPDLIPKLEGLDLHSNVVSSEGDIQEKLVREKGLTDLHRHEVPLSEQLDVNNTETSDISIASFQFDDNSNRTEIHQSICPPIFPDNTLESEPNVSGNRQETESVKLENAFANYIFDTDSNDKDFFNKQHLEKDTATGSFPTNVSSVPLFDLSSMIADRSKAVEELNDETTNEANVFDRDASVSFSENDLENKPLHEDSQEENNISDFNICETCREVTKPEIEDEKEVEDLTTQLIENIIAPIQLSNPVEVPLTEVNTPVDDRIIFDSDQCAAISHITEETMETIHGQSATKLIENDRSEKNTRSYGWCADNTSVMSKDLSGPDYTFQMNTNAIGFFGDNSMFFDDIPCNASDEIKAEFKISQDDTNATVVLPRQMSIPTAPPAQDDDSKSDENGGLDVHSIEQDAKNDFPIFEEFVIDPSETDDDKIEIKERERSSDDPIPNADTFTNRVERFKQMEENIDINDDVFDMQKKIEIVTSNSPAITIASYFDTGNYAAETHYKNSMSSSSPFSQINVCSPSITTRIPPGFESEYQRRLSGISSDSTGQIKNEPCIPDCTTQTKVTSTTTFSTVHNTIQDTFPKIIEQTALFSKLDLKEQTQESSPEKLPPFASIFGVNKDIDDHSVSSVSKTEEANTQMSSFLGLHPVKLEGGDAASIFADKPPLAESLPDPLSFFTSKEEPKEETDNSFNRLASYFSTPTKTDPAKSFFELSQSQNHYRHASSVESAGKINISPNHNKVIPNTNLINDLSSIQNIVNDQVVRTVNYFTVVYDSNINIDKMKLTEPKYCKDDLDEILHKDYSEVEEKYNDDVIKEVKSCNDCCNITKEYKKLYRRVMDNDNSDKRPDKMNITEGKNSKRDKKEGSVKLEQDDEANDEVSMLTESRPSVEYTPVRHHWFYRVDQESKSLWRGFSSSDSKALEEAFNSPNLNENTLVPTDGGRYDVNVIGRLRIAVYWSDKPTNVRRCSWFYKGNTDARYVPYPETIAEKLEEEYRHGMTTGEWHRRLVLPNNELVVMHGPAVMVHLLQANTDGFGSTPLFSFGKRVYRNPPKIRVCRDQRAVIDHLIFLVHGAGEYESKKQQEKYQSAMRPRVVRRGWDESEIEDTEPSNIDHLLLLCHGVGSACDMRFRSVEEVVNDFRSTSLQLLQSHYRNSYENGIVNRVEVLPISWHGSLHSGETGVDRRLAEITLDSIPRLRNFTNDTVLDVLFYTSPLYCQTIVNTVCAELNRIYRLFKSRNPSYRGTVSLGGHSLGSVILYDLLCHQNSGQCPSKRLVGGGAPGGECSPPICYPKLDFSPAALYALGSPIAMFECIRGVDSLGDDFQLPTCTHFFNIFHPYDPIAYRIEPLINRQLKDVKPFLIPHHKGRKRMHLELKDTMARVGADLKQKLLESLKSTWSSMWKASPTVDSQLEKVVEEGIEKEPVADDTKDDVAQEEVTPELLGKLNAGRRVDYVLQEAPFEMINEYLFAMSSHVCYWTNRLNTAPRGRRRVAAGLDDSHSIDNVTCTHVEVGKNTPIM
ncbi:uncharacterized protein PAPLA1 isoform X2 [Plodia interpunctella]|uniref:uncharacterized protein PAPLA1 isoform X2 n=1 Tax=Plodia interpunctella TaxID=58824 RepID=UPI0023674BC0|nr:uncharacterized protein LOC128682109 isoform X2 [Plodia interpunctella]